MHILACSGPVILNKIVTFLQQSYFYEAARNTPLVNMYLRLYVMLILGPAVGCLASASCHLTVHYVVALQPPGVARPAQPDIGRAYLFAALMFVFPLVGAMALVHSNRLAIQVQIKLRAELTSAVYRKALRLSARCDAGQ